MTDLSHIPALEIDVLVRPDDYTDWTFDTEPGEWDDEKILEFAEELRGPRGVFDDSEALSNEVFTVHSTNPFDYIKTANYLVLRVDLTNHFPDSVSFSSFGSDERLLLDTGDMDLMRRYKSWTDYIGEYSILDEDVHSEVETAIAEIHFNDYGREETIDVIRDSLGEIEGLGNFFDDQDDILPDKEGDLFRIFEDSYRHSGEFSVTKRSLDNAMSDIRYMWRVEYERYQPPLEQM